MIKKIGDILIEKNMGVTKDRVDNSDISCCLMVLSGIHHDTAYYVSKCKGLLSESVISQRADAYFDSDKIKGLLDALRPLVAPVAVDSISDWRNADVEALTPEELERMGTVLLRDASKKGDVDTKEINDLIKMLDSVGALPKKKQEDKDVKQVVVNVPFNSVCSCGKEIFNPNVDDYFTRRILSGDYVLEIPADAAKELKKNSKKKI